MAGIDGYTKLLLHCDGTNDSTTIVDDSGTSKSCSTGGNAKLKTSEKKFGTASCYFDGNADYIQIADHDDLHFAHADFTMDFWVKFTALNIRQTIWCQEEAINNVCDLMMESTNKLRFFVYHPFGYAAHFYSSSALSVSTGNWYHIAIARSGSTCYMFLDGTSLGVDTVTAFGTISNIPAVAKIGFDVTQYGASLNGYVDEFRLSKGIARWTSSFTPPTEAYSSGSASTFKPKIIMF